MTMSKLPSNKKFEGSRFDKDKGVKEGSPADRKRDKVEKEKMAKAEKRKKR